MKNVLICTFVFILSQMLAACATESIGSRDIAAASKGGGTSRPEAAPAPRTQGPPRTQGTVMSSHPSKNPPPNNPGAKDDSHKVVVNNPATGKDESHKVIVDHRPAPVVSHDPHARVMVRHTNFRPQHDWDHFHPVTPWFGVWGINDWSTVGTVTCQAADEVTGELYPVTMQRDSTIWDDSSINNVLDQALDDCALENPVADGTVSPCIASIPACTFETWDGTIYRPN